MLKSGAQQRNRWRAHACRTKMWLAKPLNTTAERSWSSAHVLFLKKKLATSSFGQICIDRDIFS
jgi:hypothetical protein